MTETGEYTKDGSSKYTEVPDALIGAFVDAHPQIDRPCIYIGGCSNGGFGDHETDHFQPVPLRCRISGLREALADAFISDEDILEAQRSADLVYTRKNDPVVVPDDFVVPTYEASGKGQSECTLHLLGQGTFGSHRNPENADGTPFRIHRPLVLIPMLNDECVLDYDGKTGYDGRKRNSDSGVDGCTEKSITQHLLDSPPTADCCSEKTDGMKSDFKADFISSVFVCSCLFSLFRLISSTVQVG